MSLIQCDSTLISNREALSVSFADPDKAGDYLYVQFQYPPRINSDSRKIKWETTQDLAGMTEPITIYSSSSPREINISFTYIFNKLSMNGVIWNAQAIQRNVRLVRGYFQRVKQQERQRNLGIWLRLWGIGGTRREMTARMTNLDVKYSETLIKESSMAKPEETKPLVGGKEDGRSVAPERLAFPFKTDLTMTLCLWTQGAALDINDDPVNFSPLNQLGFLEEGITREWY